MRMLQHNMWVTNASAAAFSIITGGGKWVELSICVSARGPDADLCRKHLI
jgi:hypothetical protein